MYDDILFMLRRLFLAALVIATVASAASFGTTWYLLARPARVEAEALRAEVAELKAALGACRERGDPVEQYYRGAYDLCVTVLGLPYAGDCLDAVRRAYAGDRHEDSSFRWHWPPPTPTPPPSPDREARAW